MLPINANLSCSLSLFLWRVLLRNSDINAPLKAFTPPDCHFNSIHVDIVGPLPPSKGYTYLFTCIDRYTCWPEATPMVDATAESCTSALLTGWISHFGVPTMITSCQGKQFESDLWHSLMNLFGATHLTSQHTTHRQMVLSGGSTGTLKQA